MNANQPEPTQRDADEDAAAGNAFERASRQPDPGLVAEFVYFLKDNKKWWLTPILVITLLLVALVFLTSSPAAPFIYTLF